MHSVWYIFAFVMRISSLVELDLDTGVDLAILLNSPFPSPFILFVMILNLEVDGFLGFNFNNPKSYRPSLEILCMKRNK